jgi:peptidoglycan/LPS O-acetylase OafA/YrhL
MWKQVRMAENSSIEAPFVSPPPEEREAQRRPSHLYAPRYDMLDAWRGVAALGVVLCHTINVAWLGGVSVLMFFVISGYCISAAAEACRIRGLSFGTFMYRRVHRIFPPYWLALTFFALTRVVKIAMTGENQLSKSPVAWLQNITLTQWLTLLFHPSQCAFTNTTTFMPIAWTLNYEEQFYLLTALLLALFAFMQRRHARTASPMFSAIFVLTLAGIVWNAIFPQTVFGLFIDYWADFGVGCLVFYRLCRLTNRPARAAIDVTLMGLMVWGYLARIRMGGTYIGDPRLAPWELAIASFWAVLFIVARPLSGYFCSSAVGRWFMRLGLISYSLYLVHQFNMHFVRALAFHILPGAPHAILVVIQLIAQIIIASIFWYFCERPFLNRSFSGESRKSCVVESVVQASPVIS